MHIVQASSRVKISIICINNLLSLFMCHHLLTIFNSWLLTMSLSGPLVGPQSCNIYDHHAKQP